MKVRILLCAVLAAAAVAGFAPKQQPVPSSFGGEKFITRPSRDSVLGFSFPAEIVEVLVKGGQQVKRGEPLIRARDEDVRAQRDLAKLITEVDLDVQKAQYGVDLARVEFDAQKELRDKKAGGNVIDYARAEATLKARTVDLEIAKHERKQQALQLAIRQAQLDRLTILAPFDGVIDDVIVDVGQVKRETEPVLRIVNTDPLWIDVPTPTSQTLTRGLKTGDPAWVVLDLPGDGAGKVWKAKVIEVGAAADPASNTRRVRVELANPSQWPSGMTAWVRFTPPEGEWAARVVEPDKRAAAK
ncbi:MAG: efflux RND transporter periplasmic adaptor subunit [Phycisphaeraceae bacterium]|nr:efflux RND transporter periplasmic adaptor subunit [Phycisphaeraceae bacterium]